jgi:hypothetical protein
MGCKAERDTIAPSVAFAKHEGQMFLHRNIMVRPVELFGQGILARLILHRQETIDFLSGFEPAQFSDLQSCAIGADSSCVRAQIIVGCKHDA